MQQQKVTLSATAPDTIVAPVAANANWNIQKASSLSLIRRAHPLVPMPRVESSPKAMPYPISHQQIAPMLASKTF